MRKFTPKEKEFLKKIVEFKGNSNLQELQLMRLLRKQLETLAISWELEHKCSIQIYAQFKNPTDEQWRDIQKKYFEIADYIYLIEELFEYKLIKLQEVSFENHTQENYRVLYDRDKYRVEGDSIFEKSNENNCLYALGDIHKHKVNVTFARDLEKYANSIIYPLPLLNDFIKNDFRSIEERRYDEQLCRTNLSIIVAALAIIIPLVFEKCCSDNVTTYDAQEIATAIKELKTTEIDSITQQLDTLEIKVLAPHSPVVKSDTSKRSVPGSQQNPLKQPIPKN